MQYRKAEIYPETLDLSVKKWYVYYFYLNPFTCKFERIKVYEDINRRKGAERIRYAEELRDTVNVMLRNGYSPWDEEKKLHKKTKEHEKRVEAAAAGDKNQYSIIQALNFFLTETRQNGVAKSTISRYTLHLNLFKEWLNSENMLLVHASQITAQQVLTFLNANNGKKNWSNKTYNNHLGTLQTAFNLLARKIHNVIPHNPLEGAKMKNTLSRKHAAYTDEHLAQVLAAVREQKDEYMEGVILTVYYECLRSKSELLAFRAGNVLYDRDLIKLDAEGTKGRREDYIPLDPVLKAHYISKGYDKLPSTWYLFGNNGKPAPEPAYGNYYANLFRPYRTALNLSDRYTLYGFKHTRCIHLAKAGVDPYAIIQLTRHKTLDQLMTYLRDLGLTINFDAVKNSRKI